MGHILLPDGTKVFLNASTKFRYPNEFNRTNREVYLDGEAYFDVTANKNSPFIVRTSKQKIRVLGTKFNVMDYAEDDFAITTLVSGKIELVPFDESNEIKEPVNLTTESTIFLQ
jgi:ferric-dicitrate binding protein FerR (iron transport regulator)